MVWRMTDSSLPRSSRFHPGRIPITRRDGSRGYVDGSICDQCSCNSKQQANCVFSRENSLGILAGFNPSGKYRKAHRDDISASPLMQSFKYRKPIDWGVPFDSMVLPKVKFPYFPVKTAQSIQNTLNRMRVIRREVVG